MFFGYTTKKILNLDYGGARAKKSTDKGECSALNL